MRFSRRVIGIYADFTDQIESFGIDEVWCDVSGSVHLFGSGQVIADTIRRRIREEIGLTASVGVSYNKIWAKLGSDMKKPDATTTISKENFRELVWPMPVGELLYVGRATRKKLENRAIRTIGDLAQRDVRSLRLLLGVWGQTLWSFANGLDTTPVRRTREETIIKSVGNSTTAVRDLMNNEDAKLIIYVLAESVASRLRKHNLKCITVSVSIRNNELASFERQGRLTIPSFLSGDIAVRAIELLTSNYRWDKPVRSLGVRGCDLVTADRHEQLDLFDDKRGETEQLEKTVDILRGRFGPTASSGVLCSLIDT